MNQKAIGFDTKFKAIDKNFEKPSFKNASTQDLIKFGIIPEFIGRFPVIAALDELTEKELVKVMSETKNSISDQYKYLFEMDGIELEFNKEAYVAIAEEARASASGARAIRSIFEDILQDSMFNLPSEQDVKKIVIDKKAVKTRKLPLRLLNRKAAN